MWLLRTLLVAAIPLLLIWAPPFDHFNQAGSIWGTKPVLAHFLSDPQEARRLQRDLDLNAAQLHALQHIVQQEAQQVAQLESESQIILNDPRLNFDQKTAWVAQSRYNQRIQEILADNQRRLEASLGQVAYQRLVTWIDQHWEEERRQLALQSNIYKVLARWAPGLAQAYPRSFEVYATRYEAGERKIVALPDKCLKFANGGALQCEGYAFGQAYSVAIRYEDNLVVALVGEAGPWNVDDNYWSKASDPQPRRMFVDLPLGVPEAQAAYFNGYNCGVDQFGRLVTSPVAIDISKALAADLDLPPGNNKVTVSFLWTEGWDSKAAGEASNPAGTLAASSPGPSSAITWQTATPNPDGSLAHVVQSGQTLVGIAAVYGVSLADLLTLNNLTMQSIIQPGDEILVRAAVPTPAATIMPTFTQTATPTSSPSSPASATLVFTVTMPSPASLITTPSPEEKYTPPVDWVLVGIIVTAIVSLALLTWGWALQRQKHS